MQLVTISDVKKYLNITSTTEDQYLTILTAGVDAAFRRLVGWQVERLTYTDYYDGNWTTKIALNEVPVVSITSVYMDTNGYDGQGNNSPFAAATLLTEGVDYYLQLDRDSPTMGTYSQSGLLVRCNGVWPGLWSRAWGDLATRKTMGQGNIKVTYVAGYKPVPDDIRLALCEACKMLRASRFAPGPISSEGLGEYNYSTSNYVLPQDLLRVGTMQSVVMTYRRLRLC